MGASSNFVLFFLTVLGSGFLEAPPALALLQGESGGQLATQATNSSMCHGGPCREEASRAVAVGRDQHGLESLGV
jgi:hypothetical protein